MPRTFGARPARNSRVMQAIKDRFDPQNILNPGHFCIASTCSLSMNHHNADNPNDTPNPAAGIGYDLFLAAGPPMPDISSRLSAQQVEALASYLSFIK